MIHWEGILVLGCNHKSHVMKIHCFSLKYSSIILGMDHTNLFIVMMSKEGWNTIFNFRTQGKGFVLGHIGQKVKCMISFWSSPLFLCINEKNYLYCNNDRWRSTKIINYLTHGPKVLILGCVIKKHIAKVHYLKNKSSCLLLSIDQIKNVYCNGPGFLRGG